MRGAGSSVRSGRRAAAQAEETVGGGLAAPGARGMGVPSWSSISLGKPRRGRITRSGTCVLCGLGA